MALVEAEAPVPGLKTPGDPIAVAWRTGCNPGGEVQMYEITSAMLAAMPEERLARLLTAPRHTLLERDVLLSYFPEVAPELAPEHGPRG